ncbi:hypothetical protein LguiA_027603 [Lonicera macranthoides]
MAETGSDTLRIETDDANRQNPAKDFNGLLTISEDGNLVILYGNKKIIWSSNVSIPVANFSAQLLDNGNIILRDNYNGRTIWESFEHDSNSFLPIMRVGDYKNKYQNMLNSWRTSSEPSMGNFLAESIGGVDEFEGEGEMSGKLVVGRERKRRGERDSPVPEVCRR